MIDICPYNANPKWCPSQESEPKNSVGMEYHFDVSIFYKYIFIIYIPLK